MANAVAPLRIEIVDPLTDEFLNGAPGMIAGDVTAVRIQGAEVFDLVRANVARAAAPWVEAGRRWESRFNRVLHGIGRRRDQVMYDGNPRHDSRVRQHLFLSFGEVARGLPSQPTTFPAGRGQLETLAPFEAWAKDGLRAAGTLRLPRSWPGVPVWITVEPWWRDQTITTIELRTHRRWRYPRRYFRAVHGAAQHLRDHAQENVSEPSLPE
ncbi:MAG: hypothetical protein ACI9C1_002830 [Candidatus Aldehydirespiratoraceae bacterium]|jgi:hypothetical protein